MKAPTGFLPAWWRNADSTNLIFANRTWISEANRAGEVLLTAGAAIFNIIIALVRASRVKTSVGAAGTQWGFFWVGRNAYAFIPAEKPERFRYAL